MKATITDVDKRITTKPDKTVGIISYDVDNKYPQRIVDIINSSGTGTLCTSVFGKFIYGSGFIDEALSKTVVNSKRLTANKLLFKVGKSVSKFNGLAIHVNYDANFRKTSFSFVPFQDVRFTTSDHKKHPNMLAVYDDWEKVKDSKINQKNIDFINLYNPDHATILNEVEAAGGWSEYKGQILYWSIDGVEYPLAPSDSVLEDVQTDSHAKTFKFRNITTNFMASHFLKVQAFEDDDTKEEFLNNLTLFQGSDDTSKIMMIEQESEDDLFELEKVDIQDIEKLYEYTETSVRDNIMRNYLIPPVLLLAVAGKLGSSTEILDATSFYNGVTQDYRTGLSEMFAELFDNSIFGSFESYEIIEVKAKTVPVRDTPEGKAKIIDLVMDESIPPAKKKLSLMLIYDYTEEEATELSNRNDLTVS